ncbi:MAG TPA: energy transducer TonB [Candidatus Baltobacteraceae bacterium]
MTNDGDGKTNLPLLIGSGAGAMVALVVGATLFMGHLASTPNGQAAANARGGNLFKFIVAAAAPHHAAPAPSPSAAPTATPVPTPSPAPVLVPTEAQRLAERKRMAHILALERSSTASDAGLGSGTPESSTEATKPTIRYVLPTEAPAESSATMAPRPTVAATSAQVASAPQVATPGSIYAPGTILDARFISRVEPTYPEIAREQDAHGSATVLVTIGPSGTVISARVGQSTGFNSLDNAAIEAARSSTFLPPVIDGRPATATYRVVYDFNS